METITKQLAELQKLENEQIKILEALEEKKTSMKKNFNDLSIENEKNSKRLKNLSYEVSLLEVKIEKTQALIRGGERKMDDWARKIARFQALHHSLSLKDKYLSEQYEAAQREYNDYLEANGGYFFRNSAIGKELQGRKQKKTLLEDLIRNTEEKISHIHNKNAKLKEFIDDLKNKSEWLEKRMTSTNIELNDLEAKNEEQGNQIAAIQKIGEIKKRQLNELQEEMNESREILQKLQVCLESKQSSQKNIEQKAREQFNLMKQKQEELEILQRKIRDLK